MIKIDDRQVPVIIVTARNHTLVRAGIVALQLLPEQKPPGRVAHPKGGVEMNGHSGIHEDSLQCMVLADDVEYLPQFMGRRDAVAIVLIVVEANDFFFLAERFTILDEEVLVRVLAQHLNEDAPLLSVDGRSYTDILRINKMVEGVGSIFCDFLTLAGQGYYCTCFPVVD